MGLEPPALLALALGTLAAIAALPASRSPSPLSPLLSPSLSPLSPSLPPLSLSVSPYPELGTPFNVTCTSPIPADSFSIAVDGRSLPVTLGDNGASATATVTVDHGGTARLECAARAGDSQGTASRNVQIFYVPAPLLNITANGTALSVLCQLPPGATKDIQVRLLVAPGDTVLKPWGPSPLSLALALCKDEEELELQCQAELPPLLRSTSLLLAKPRLDPSGCPEHQDWIEGQDGILHCRARGKPEPRICCSRTGISDNPGNLGNPRNSSRNFGNSSENFGNFGDSLLPGIPVRAHRDHSGLYRCRATNELGTAERNVTVRVRYEDPSPWLPALLGSLLPVLTLLVLGGFYLLYHRNTKIGQYRLWRRQRPPQARPLRAPGAPLGPSGAPGAPSGPPGASGAAGAAPNGCAATP